MRRETALLTLATLSVCACAPKPAAPPPGPVALDCSQTFEALAARITAQPHLVPAPKEKGEPYAFYSTEDGQASYVITEKGAPGHPAILMQAIAGGVETTTGCPYGNRKGYETVLAYVKSLKGAKHR